MRPAVQEEDREVWKSEAAAWYFAPLMMFLFSMDYKSQYLIFEFHGVYVFACVWLYLTFGRAAVRPLIAIGAVATFFAMPRLNGITMLGVNAAFFAAGAMLILAVEACSDAARWRGLADRLRSDRAAFAVAVGIAMCGLLTVRVGIATGGGFLGFYWQGDPVLFTLCFLLGLLGIQFGRREVAIGAALVALLVLLRPVLRASTSVPLAGTGVTKFQFTIFPGTTALIDAAAVVSFYFFGQFLADRIAGRPMRKLHRAWLIGLVGYLVVVGFNPLSIGLDALSDTGRDWWWWIATENDLLILIAVWGALLYGWVSGVVFVALAALASLPLLLLLDPAGSTLFELGSHAVKLRSGDLYVTKSVVATVLSYVFQAGLMALLADEIARRLRAGDLFVPQAEPSPDRPRRAKPAAKTRAPRRRSPAPGG